MTMKARLALAVSLALMALVALGCKTTIVGTGGETRATYRLGTLTAEEGRGIDAVYEAAQQAMNSLGLNVIQNNKDALQAQIVARDAMDKKITVKLLSVTENSTQLKIDAGSLEKGQRIYEAIRNNLAGKM